jgi:hypothetical protein
MIDRSRAVDTAIQDKDLTIQVSVKMKWRGRLSNLFRSFRVIGIL